MHQKKTLSFGFDTERPYGPRAETVDGKMFRAKQLEYIGRMNERFDAADIPRTHFILTSYLDGCRHAVGETLLRGLFRKDHRLQEV